MKLSRDELKGLMKNKMVQAGLIWRNSSGKTGTGAEWQEPGPGKWKCGNR